VAVEVRRIVDRESWLADRKKFITASAVSAMPAFNCHPYITPLRIYAEKRGVEFEGDPDNKVLRRGRWLEPAIQKAVEELKGGEWGLTAPNVFLSDTTTNLAATPDFYISGDPRGRGILEAKSVAWSVWKREWQEGSDIPLWVTLQCLTTMMLADAAFGTVAVLLVDPHNMDCKILDVPRHPGAEAKIVNEAKRFWQDIQNGIEPPIDFERDGSVIRLLLPRELPGSSLDLTGNNEIPDLLARRAAMCAEMSRLKRRCEIIENKLRMIMGDHAVATGIEDFSISYKTQKRKGYVVEPSEPRVLLIKDKRPPDRRPQVDDDDDNED